MKDQVTSIEQSKRLIELGVPAEKASMVWEYWINQDFSKDVPEEVIYNLNTKANRGTDWCDMDIPAFTVADLLEVLPKAIWDDVKGWSLLVIRFRSKGFPKVGYEAEHGIIWSCGDVSLLGNIIETIDWVVANGYGLDI